jgi:hypothetical protein
VFLPLYYSSKNNLELFNGGKELFDVIYSISIGYIVSYIFYLLNVYLPKKENENFFNDNVTLTLAILHNFLLNIEYVLELKKEITPQSIREISNRIRKLGVVKYRPVRMNTILSTTYTDDYNSIFKTFFDSAEYILKSVSNLYSKNEIPIYINFSIVINSIKEKNKIKDKGLTWYLFEFGSIRREIRDLILDLNKNPIFNKRYGKVFNEMFLFINKDYRYELFYDEEYTMINKNNMTSQIMKLILVFIIHILFSIWFLSIFIKAL